MSKRVIPKAKRLIDNDIAKLELKVTTKVASESPESVYISKWGIFYRRDDGWHGPGGFYGPSTPMAQACEAQSQKYKEILTYYYEAMQRHHDFFVFRYRETGGVLTEVERKNYESAMAREAAELVKPLPEDAINYFKVEQEKPKESKG